MNEFKILAKRDGRIIINHFLEIKSNPKRIVIYLFYLFWIGSLIFNVVLRSRNPAEIQAQLGGQMLGAGFVGFGTAFILFFLYRGTMESSTFFTMGDVHLLFPAPLSPKKILLYSMIKQSLLYFFLYGFVISGLMPMIANTARINLQYLPYMYLGFIGLVLAIRPLDFLVFALGSKYGIQLRLQQGIFLFILLFVLYLVGSIIAAGDLLQGLMQGLNASFIDFLPVVGWSKVVFMTAITGYSTFSIVALVFQLLFLACCIILSYYTADDYYEDTLEATEKRNLRKQQKQGLKKANRLDLPFFKKKKVIVSSKGTGPWALLWRSKVEYSRSDLHPYLGFWTIIFLLAGIVIGFFGAKHTDGIIPVYFANGVIAYLVFIFSASKAGQHELTKPYIYLIPGSNLLKIISSNLTDILRMSVNILALNIPLGILLNAPPQVIVIMVIFVVSFYYLNLSSGFLIRVIFPNAFDQKTLYPLFLMLQIILLLLPGAIVGGGMAFIYQDVLLAFVGISVVNIIIIGVLLLLSNAVFARMEWK